MKKNVLALSIAAMVGGFAGVASAQTFPNSGMVAPTATTLERSEGGAGHILVVPYFTSQNDNMSVFHVVNTDTVNGKALKVRFRGAANSDDILDFTVFLSWSPFFGSARWPKSHLAVFAPALPSPALSVSHCTGRPCGWHPGGTMGFVDSFRVFFGAGARLSSTSRSRIDST